MSRRKRNRNRSQAGAGVATREAARPNVRMLREQVEYNNLQMEEFRQRAVLGALASVQLAKTSDAIARAHRARESAYDLEQNLVNPADYLYDEYAGPGRSYQGAVPSAIWHTEEGRRYPVYINEWDLRPIRAMGYMMATFHPMGVGIMSKLTNYTIGKGITPTVTPDKRCADNVEIRQAALIAQGIVDDFIEINRVHGDSDREKFLRAHRDGDGGIGLWHEGNGMVSMRFVEPDQITERLNATHLQYMGYDGPESNFLFGIHTDTGDTNAVHGYAVQWTSAGNDWDYMPGGNIPFYSSEPDCQTASQETWLEFFKVNVDRNQKRGFNDFFSVEQYLTLSTKVMGNAGEGAAIQAAIAFIREHAPGVTTGQIDSFQLGIASNPNTPCPGPSGQPVYAQRFLPGTTLDIPQGQKYTNGPMGNQNAQNYIAVGDALARIAGMRWDAPEWFFNGDASGTNRASSFVAESPFVKKEEVEQEAECDFWKRILWRVLGFNHRVGKFGDMPFHILRRSLNLGVTAAQINVREPEKETGRRAVLCENGIISKKQWAQEEGYDYEQQVKDGAKAQEVPGAPPATLSGGSAGRSSQGGESAAREAARNGKKDPSYDPEHPEECCPSCGARLERGDDGKCNRCGKPWPEKSTESAADDFLAEEREEYGPGGQRLGKVRPERYTDPDSLHYHSGEEDAAADQGWIGVDLDSTLAHSPNGKFEPGKIGPPVPAMVVKVKAKLAEGQPMRILTARVASTVSNDERATNRKAIELWCQRYLGQALPVTAEKDPMMIECWDDRSRRVQADAGEFESAAGLATAARKVLEFYP